MTVIAEGFAIVSEETDKRLVAYSGKTNGFYTTRGKAEGYLKKKLNAYTSYAKHNESWAEAHRQNVEYYSKFRVVPVQIVVNEA